MKKRVFLLSVILLLSALMFSTVAAADFWVSLGSWEKGDEISYELTDPIYSVNSVINYEGDVPPGCTIIPPEEAFDDNGDDALQSIVLSGILSEAGDYSFSVTADEDVYTFNLTVLPETPTVSLSSVPSECEIGSYAEISVTAYTQDGGELSYFWYCNGQPMLGATSSSLVVDTDTAGTVSYFCEVTNTVNGVSASARTDTVSVTIASPEIASIAVCSYPKKTTYTVGDNFDAEGLTLTVTYTDGSSVVVDSGYSFSPTKMSSSGTKTIVISYLGQMCTLKVTVEEPKDERVVSVITMPSKTDYTVGDWLDTTNMQLRITDGDSHKDVSTGFTCSPTTLNTAGIQQITVTYDGLTTKFTVNVSPKTESTLKIKTLPSKVSYTVGDSLDTSGLVLEMVTVTGSSSSAASINSGFTCEPAVLTKAGIQTISVKYEKLSTSFTVKVITAEEAQKAEATPSPSPSSEPSETPQPTQSPIQSSTTKTSRSNIGLFIFIVLVAILALAILAVYIFIAKSENFEDTELGRFIQELIDKLSR